MKTISLKEHSPTTTTLTTEEFALLSQVREVAVRLLDLSSGETELRPGSTVGTVILGDDLRVLIRPKVALENVFFLLSYGKAEWAAKDFDYESAPDLLEALGWMLESEVGHAVRAGISRGYVAQQESLITLRGRFDTTEQIRVRQARPLPIECRYEEFTPDIPLNRVVRAGLRTVLSFPALDPDLARRIRYRVRSFDEVSDVGFRPDALPEVAFDRLTDRWLPSFELASLALRSQAIRDREGAVVGRAFTVDMNTLFEDFITAIVREEAARAGLALVPQAKRQFSTSVRMKPDLVVQRDWVDVGVGDVKYKEREVDDWEHADLYQVLGYCSAMGLPRGLLIYAADRAPQVEVIQRSGIQIEVLGVDLAGGRAEIESRARWAAGRLLDQAKQLESTVVLAG